MLKIKGIRIICSLNSIYSDIDESTNLESNIEIYCDKCEKNYSTTYHKFLFGDQCHCHLKDIIKNNDVNKINQISKYYHNNTVQIIDVLQIKGIHSRIQFKCNSCHKIFKQDLIKHLKGYPCPICSESQGEKMIRYFLIRNQIKFIKNMKFNDLKGLSYDFYLEDKNILIEYNGIQHFQPIKKFGGQKRFKKQLINDQIKKQYAEKNGFVLFSVAEQNRLDNITIFDLFKKLLK